MIEGQTVDFQCEAKGHPQPVIAWTKGGETPTWPPGCHSAPSLVSQTDTGSVLAWLGRTECWPSPRGPGSRGGTAVCLSQPQAVPLASAEGTRVWPWTCSPLPCGLGLAFSVH